jgi:copper chaperone CopZ
VRTKIVAIWVVAVAFLTLNPYVAAVDSESKSPAVTISVEGMHCLVCAKKIESKLKAIAGVDMVKVDVMTGIVVVSPKEKKHLSSRALWETIEKAGYKPTKIASPAGTFKEKPKT